MNAILIAWDQSREESAPQWRFVQLKIREKFPKYWECLPWTWIVDTDLSPEQVREKILSTLIPDDQFLVIRVTADDMFWRGYSNRPDWLRAVV